MGRTLRLLAGGATLLILAGAGAQSGGRRPAFGRVVDTTGAPLAGVEVTFAGGRPEVDERLVEDDVLVVASDRRGRVRAKLRSELCYVAWVCGPVGEGGTTWYAEPISYFAADGMFELVCRQVTLRRVAVEGVEAWQEHGPLQFFALTPHPGTEVELEPDAFGRLLLPTLSTGWLEVRSADGRPLWAEYIGRGAALPPPQEVRVRAVDEQGQPVAGATISYRVGRFSAWNLDGVPGHVRERMREVGVTGADGSATVVVPFDGDPLQASQGEMLLTVRAPGRAAVVGGVMGGKLYVDDCLAADFHGHELPFTLPKVEPVVLAPGLVPAGTTAQLTAVCKLRTSQNGYRHDPRTFFAETLADGALAFADVPADLHSMRVVLASGDGTRVFGFRSQSGRTLPMALQGGAKPERLTDRLGELRLRVLDETGGPARGCVACVVPLDADTLRQRESIYRVPLDATGRGSLHLERGQWLCVVFTPSGYGKARCMLGELAEVELPAAPLPRMEVRLLDDDGQPVEGARLHVARQTSRSTRDPEARALALFASQLSSVWPGLATDAAGALAIPFLPLEHYAWEVALRWDGGGTDPFELAVTEAPLALRPR